MKILIRYALVCLDCDERFESWFASSAAYDRLSAAGQLACPACESAQVAKQIMAPSVRTSQKAERETQAERAFAAFAAKAREHVATHYDYVGDSFAQEARAIHDGDAPERGIWGQVTPDEARALSNEGVPALPLPAPLAPKPPKPDKKIN